jgi:hypothetical protein
MTTRYRFQGGVPQATLAAGISAGATSFDISDFTGWPTNFPYTCIINKASTSSRERIIVGGHSGNTLNTITRGVDGTTGQTHNLGDTIELCVLGSTFDELGQLLGGTAGDTFYYDGTTLQRLAKGVSEQMLKQGASVPGWSWKALPVFASAAARTTADGSPADGDASYLNAGDATEGPEFYNGSNWRKPWNLPWGIIAVASVTANQTGISAEADLTSLTVTFTAITGRRYRTMGHTLMKTVTTSGNFSVFITDGASTHVGQASGSTATLGFTVSCDPVAVETITAGSVTRKLRASTSAGTVDLQAGATFPNQIWVEDIGPSGNPT